MDQQPSLGCHHCLAFSREWVKLYTFQLLGLRQPREGISKRLPHFSSTREGYFRITIPHLHLVNNVTKAYISLKNLLATSQNIAVLCSYPGAIACTEPTIENINDQSNR